MPHALKAFRILLPLTLIVVGVLWILGRERETTINVAPFSADAQPSRASAPREIPAQQNLTKRVAKEIAEELLAKNQNGPQETGGELKIALDPDATLWEMMQAVKAAETQPFEGVPLQELRVGTADSPDARQAYFAEMRAVLERTLGAHAGTSTILDAFTEALTSKKTDALAAMVANHRAAIAGLKEIPVPPSLATLHKREIDLLMKTSVMLEGMALVSTDPLRAYLAFQLYPKLIEEAKALQQEFSSAESRSGGNPISWLIAPAYAAVPTFETHPLLLAIYPRDEFEYLMRLLTEILKDQILQYLRDLVMRFVRGDGANCSYSAYFSPGGQTYCPKFVLNWEQALFGAQEAADARLEREIAQSNIPESHKEALIRTLGQPSGDGYGTTFDTLTQNAESCEGIDDPAEELRCLGEFQNTIGGQFLAKLQRQEELREKYEEAKKAETVAAQGFESRRKCVDAYETQNGRGVCINWQITEPGIITEEITAKTATADWDRVVNAFDLQSLLSALVSMFINQLMQAAEEGLLGIIESGIQPGPTPLPTPPGPIFITMSVTPSQTISPGESATISWNATNATACTASGAWSGQRATSGSETVAPLQTSTYTLTCTDQYGGAQSQSVTITVTGGGGGGGGEL